MYVYPKRHDSKLDPDRPNRTAGDESFVTQACFGAAPLVERRSAGAVRYGSARLPKGGVGAVRDSGHVWGVGGRRNAGERGELGDGGHGWDAFG